MGLTLLFAAGFLRQLGDFPAYNTFYGIAMYVMIAGFLIGCVLIYLCEEVENPETCTSY